MNYRPLSLLSELTRLCFFFWAIRILICTLWGWRLLLSFFGMRSTVLSFDDEPIQVLALCSEADTFPSQDAELKMNHSALACTRWRLTPSFFFTPVAKYPKAIANQGMQATAIKISGEACHGRKSRNSKTRTLNQSRLETNSQKSPPTIGRMPFVPQMLCGDRG